MRFRPASHADLPELVALQEAAAVVALAHIFPQDQHPFPRAAILKRWAAELDDPDINVYVSTDAAARLTGFAARRDDELLHFGTAVASWGTGLATALHDSLIQTYPENLPRIWLRVFMDNHQARRFWEKLGWQSTGHVSQSPFPPYPALVEYELRRKQSEVGDSGAARR